MAKATIILTDQEDGGVHVSMKFDPPLDTKTPGAKCTLAQEMAFECLSDIKSMAEDIEE